VNDERAVLPFNLHKSSLNVTLDFDAGTTRKCGHASSTAWNRDDRASEGVRAAHRVMRGARGRPGANRLESKLRITLRSRE
jgi:hypothetical protein